MATKLEKVQKAQEHPIMRGLPFGSYCSNNVYNSFASAWKALCEYTAILRGLQAVNILDWSMAHLPADTQAAGAADHLPDQV